MQIAVQLAQQVSFPFEFWYESNRCCGLCYTDFLGDRGSPFFF